MGALQHVAAGGKENAVARPHADADVMLHTGIVEGGRHVGLQDDASPASAQGVRRALEHLHLPAGGAQAGGGQQAGQRAADDQGAAGEVVVGHGGVLAAR